MSTEVRQIATPRGEARVHLHASLVEPSQGCLVLGHGAGGRAWSADLVLLADELPAHAWTVVLVEQPWRVAGRTVATPPASLDAAWVPVVADLREQMGAGLHPLIVGGRSAGARVACRTAEDVRADGVLCLAFPLHPPGRPDRSRAAELAMPVEAGLPVEVVQGERDPFGTPAELRAAEPRATVAAVTGGHGFSRDLSDVGHAVRQALRRLGAGGPTC